MGRADTAARVTTGDSIPYVFSADYASKFWSETDSVAALAGLDLGSWFIIATSTISRGRSSPCVFAATCVYIARSRLGAGCREVIEIVA